MSYFCYIYIYIYIERERERGRDTHTPVKSFKKIIILWSFNLLDKTQTYKIMP